MKKLKVLFLFLITATICFGDNIDNIRKEIEKIENSIKEKRSQIVSIKKEESELFDILDKIEKEMAKIKSEYSSNSQKRSVLIKNIETGKQNIKKTEQELASQNSFMRKKITLWYRYNSGTNFEYLLHGDNILEVVEKQNNLKRMIEHDQGLIKNLREIKQRLEEEKRKVEREKSELDKVIAELAKQQEELDKNIKEKNRVLKLLQGKERKVSKEVSSLASKKKKMEKEIERIIKERAKKAKSKEEKSYEASTIVSKIGSAVMPLGGEVVVGYGQEKAGNVRSSGIEIKGKLGDRIKSCADGEVIYTGKMENMGTVIIINHGYGFVSVYGNLITSYVGVGANVTKGQNIGVLGLSAEEREPILYFETRLRAKIVSPYNFVK